MHTHPFTHDILQNVHPYHEVLLSCKPHRSGCHQWRPMQHRIHDDLKELQPDVIVERYLDAKYYHYAPEDLYDMCDYNPNAKYLAESDQIVTLTSMETEDCSLQASLNIRYLLDIDLWQSGTTRIMQDGVVIKGLAPRRLDPVRYHLNPYTDLNELEKGMPWRTTQDEFGKFKSVDHAGRIYHGTPFSVEPYATSKHIFVASMMHTSMRSPVLRDKPDVTCPSDFPDSERHKEVVHHEQIPDCDRSKFKKNMPDKKSNVVIKAKNIPVTPKTVASSQGVMHERWLVSIYKEIENFLQNMAIEDADPSLVVRWKSSGRWPLPCQIVFVLKPLTQSQQMGDDVQAEYYKHKSRLVICGSFASRGEHSTTTTNLDAPLLRLMLSLACSAETTWSSIDITSAFLNAGIHDDDTVLVTPPPILVRMDIVKPNTAWRVKKLSMTFKKHRDNGNKSVIRNSVIWSSCIEINLHTLSKATFIQAYGSLQKARKFLLRGFHHSIIL